MVRMFLCCLISSFLVSCTTTVPKDVGTPAKAERVAGVEVGLSDLLPGWVRVSDEKLTAGHNAVYAYAREIGSGKVLVATFMEIDVYSAEQVTPRFLCHRTAEEVLGEHRTAPVLVGGGGRRCYADLWADDDVVAMRGATDAFYANDVHIVHVNGSWPRESHNQRNREYKRLIRSIVLTSD